MNLIIKLHEIFNMIKGFEGGYSTNSQNKMIIDYEDKRYLIEIEEIPKNKDLFEDIKRFCK